MARSLSPSPQSAPQDSRPLFDLQGVPRSGRILVLGAVMAAGLGLFLGVQPAKPALLLVVVALMALGTDGILRANPHGRFEHIGDSAPYLFVPVLFTLAAGLFLQERLSGYWQAPAVLVVAVAFCAAVAAEYVTVQPLSPSFPLARLVLSALTYLTAFGFYSVVYSFDVALLPSAFAVAMVSLLLGVEVFREGEADPFRALVFAAACGLVVAEARWTLYFIPLDGYLAATFLLLVFYLSTGVVHHHMDGQLDRQVGLEFAGVSVVGLAVVILGRLLGG